MAWGMRRDMPYTNTTPFVRVRIRDGAGPKNLTGVQSVVLRFSDGVTAFTKTAAVVDAANGVVEYQQEAGAPIAKDTFGIKADVTYVGGATQTFPSSQYVPVLHVHDDFEVQP